MLKNRTIIESEVNGRGFRLECPSESVWEEVLQVLENIRAFSEARIAAIKKAQEEVKEAEVIEEVQ